MYRLARLRYPRLYDVLGGTRLIQAFVDRLAKWYLRRSRRRFWKSESDADKQAAYATLYEALVAVSKLLAPTMPYIAEELYQNLVRSVDESAPESVHLAEWPAFDAICIDETLNAGMQLVMKLASLWHAARNQAALQVRQQLSEAAFSVGSLAEARALERYADLLADELNVKGVRALGSAGEVVSYQLNPLPKQLGQKYKHQFLVGDNNASKIEPIVGQAYDRFDYIRIWWPNQDYYDLTKERILNAISNPEMRAAIFKIWLNRDFTDYARITNSNSFSLSTWQPSQKFRLYVRKDIIAKVWQFGSVPQEGTIVADPYEGTGINLAADVSLNGSDLSIPFSKPRAIAVAPDGSLYIADSGNHRILHFGNDLKLRNTWGQFGDINSGSASPGRFNEPWGIAVGLDGSVYVADTWNHRIQKFTAEGIFITSFFTLSFCLVRLLCFAGPIVFVV